MTPEIQLFSLFKNSSHLRFICTRHLELEWDLYNVIKDTGVNPNIRPIKGDATDLTITFMNQSVKDREREIITMFDIVINNVGACLLSKDKKIRELTNFVLEKQEKQ